MPSRTMKQVEMECKPPLRIPPELISLILKRLPVRSLNRLQYVCKDWKNLINDPSFIQEHLRYAAHETNCLLYHGHIALDCFELHTIDKEMQVFPVERIPMIEFLPGARVIGSINGLLCVNSNYECLKILLWNPATSKFRMLATQGEAYFRVKMGFGFCSIVNDYKVVIISYPGVPHLIDKVEVYSLSTNSWKELEVGEFLDGVEIISDGFGTNGAIFWLGYKKENGHLLVSYHIATEEFALIPSPISASVPFDLLCNRLSVYENKLAVLSHNTIGKSEYSLIDLWVMEEVNDGKSEERWSWTKKYSIKHPYLLFPGVVWRNMIVCNHVGILSERSTAAEHNVIDDRIHVVLVNITTDELKRFAVPKYGAGFFVFNYVESLVPVDNIEEL